MFKKYNYYLCDKSVNAYHRYKNKYLSWKPNSCPLNFDKPSIKMH